MDEMLSITTNVENKSYQAKKLSEVLYGINWNSLLPKSLSEFKLKSGDTQRLFKFIQENQNEIVGEETFKSAADSIENKKRYYENCADIFEFHFGNELVGIAVCNPTDWCSYYLRYILIKKEHHGNHLQNQFVRFIMENLSQYNVERIEVDFSPAHMAQAFSYQRMGFYFVGSTLSERWGSILRYVKFLNPIRRDKYLDQFCQGIKSRA